MNAKRASEHYKIVSDVTNLNSNKAEERHEGRHTRYDIEKLIKEHVQPAKWIEHMEQDIMRYWLSEDATSLHPGLFPTYRTNKGESLPKNKEDWPEEFKEALKDPDTNGLIDTDYNYVRAHSRQTYAYGVAYNMTGNARYLELCKKGAYALIKAFDGSHGMFTKQEIATGTWGEDQSKRTSQDLAYGISGMGMYYYLTHDEEMLYKILQAKNYIFEQYFDAGKGIFTWEPKTNGSTRAEIVAQLDQIYGYMIWLTPSLPEPYQGNWKNELKMIAQILIERFYSQRFGFFWGATTSNYAKTFGTDHTDFGHSVKTMWLIYEIGNLTNETSFIIFAREKMDQILKNAYIKETGSWGRRFVNDPQTNKRVMDKDKEWWGLAELNQACAILSINDPSYLSYLNNTYNYWFAYMVDKEHGEIWHFVSAKDNKPYIKYPKIHSWKNAYHSAEHALFGYITSSEVKNKDFDLYYAFHSKEEVTYDRVAPYLFKGNIVSAAECGPLECMEDGNKKIRVTYNMLH